MRRLGAIWPALLGVLVLLLICAVVGFLWYKNGYDRAITLEEQARSAWANVEAQLQRRLELVPNLVQTVKGYASHEKELFENIAKSREKYFQADTRAAKIQAANELSGLLSRLLMLQENYPQLKASESFRDLLAQLEGTENRIAVARTRYNDAARALNSYTRQFFGSFFCRRAGVKPVEYFQASEEAKTQAPKVEF